MIEIHESAQSYFRKLIEGQGIDGLGLRLAVSNPGTPQAECELSRGPHVPVRANPGSSMVEIFGRIIFEKRRCAALLLGAVGKEATDAGNETLPLALFALMTVAAVGTILVWAPTLSLVAVGLRSGSAVILALACGLLLALEQTPA